MRHLIHTLPAGGRRSAALALVLALLLTLATLPAALAHAVVIRSDPPDGGVVSAAPSQIRLWFSEPVSPEVAQASILDVNGAAVPGAAAQIDAADPTLMVIGAPKLPDGVYTMVYAALAQDGHASQGHVTFRVAAAGGRGSAAATPASLPVAPLEVILRWLDFTALAAVAGAIAVAAILLSPGRVQRAENWKLAEPLGRARVRVLRWAGWCSLAGLALGAALLVWQATLFVLPAGAGGATTLGTALLRLLQNPGSGTLWLLHEALLLALAGMLFALAGRAAAGDPEPWGAAGIPALFAVAGLLTQSLAGHAAALASGAAVAVAADALHLLAASLWVGGLLALAVGLLPLVLAGRGTPAFAALAAAGWRPFGGLAAASVAALFATGLYELGREVASPDALLTSFYGRVLIGKIVLVLATGFFGLLNSSLLHPKVAAPLARLFGRPPGWIPVPLQRFPALVAAELALGLLVFLASGTLTSTTPATGPQYAAKRAGSAGSSTQRAADLVVTFEAKPNRPGQNILVIRVADAAPGPAPAEILRVIVRFIYQGQHMGTTFSDAHLVSPGVYQVVGEQFSLAGPWQIQVAVRRKGLEDAVTTFAWTVAQPGSDRPVVVSAQPLEPILTPAAAGLSLSLLLVLVWVALRRRRLPFDAGKPTRAKG